MSLSISIYDSLRSSHYKLWNIELLTYALLKLKVGVNFCAITTGLSGKENESYHRFKVLYSLIKSSDLDIEPIQIHIHFSYEHVSVCINVDAHGRAVGKHQLDAWFTTIHNTRDATSQILKSSQCNSCPTQCLNHLTHTSTEKRRV